MTGLLHVSLHDVAPLHLARVLKAQSLLREMGVDRVTCLLVPDFHHLGRSDNSSKFLEFCHQDDGLVREWALHGYAHLEIPVRVPASDRIGLRIFRRLVRSLLTAGEGEFLALPSEEAAGRIQEGMKIFAACLDSRPEIFVPPAWLRAPNFHQILVEQGIEITEDHRYIHDLKNRRSHRATAITWATRSPLRKTASIACASILAAVQAGRPLVRVAIHPSDIDHPATVASIRRTLAGLLQNHTCASLKEICRQYGGLYEGRDRTSGSCD